MKIEPFFCRSYVTTKPRLCRAITRNLRHVYDSDGCVSPDQAAIFLTIHNFELARLLKWDDVTLGKDPYTGRLSSLSSVRNYPVLFRKNLYCSAMMGLSEVTQSQKKSMLKVFGFNESDVSSFEFERPAAPSKYALRMLWSIASHSRYKYNIIRRMRKREAAYL